MAGKGTIAIKDLPQKMHIIFAYYCTGNTNHTEKARELAIILNDRAKINKQDTNNCIDESQISYATLLNWSDPDKNNPKKYKITQFTDILEFDTELKDAFENKTSKDFFEIFSCQKISISQLFEKFRATDYPSWGKIIGFYTVLYPTPDLSLSVSIVLILEQAYGDKAFRLCCDYNGLKQEYNGYWSIENKALYAFFYGPKQDCVSTILANLPTPTAIKSPFQGILVSTDMKGIARSPFSTKILFIPLVTDFSSFQFDVKNKNFDLIWTELKSSIPETFQPSELKNKICNALYLGLKDNKLVKLDKSDKVEEICNALYLNIHKKFHEVVIARQDDTEKIEKIYLQKQSFWKKLLESSKHI